MEVFFNLSGRMGEWERSENPQLEAPLSFPESLRATPPVSPPASLSLQAQLRFPALTSAGDDLSAEEVAVGGGGTETDGARGGADTRLRPYPLAAANGLRRRLLLLSQQYEKRVAGKVRAKPSRPASEQRLTVRHVPSETSL